MSESKTPWRHHQVFKDGTLVRDEIIAADGMVADDIRTPDDAALIVRAVNCHADLLEALQLANRRISMMRAALGIGAKRTQAETLDAEQRGREAAIAKATHQ